METSFKNDRLRYLYYFAIIPIRSTYTMSLNYPLTAQSGTASADFTVETENENFTVMSSS